ncbi:MAG: tetratricopeptide repeat protein [Pseudobdellovibrionaceae bacterium]
MIFLWYFIFCYSLGFATTSIRQTEDYKNIIEKAFNLSLQKEKFQALFILHQAYKNETAKKTAQQDIKSAFKKVSRLFLTEKAQQLYELAISLAPTDNNQALTKIIEALREEPENFFLFLQQARFLIAKGDCDAALEVLQKWKEFINLDAELALVFAQTQVCLKKYKESDEVKKNNTESIKSSGLGIYWLLLDMLKSLEEKNRFAALDQLNAIRQNDKDYPELYYWEWKMDFINKMNNKVAAENYQRRCSRLTAKTFRKYLFDPYLCRRIGEVQSAN